MTLCFDIDDTISRHENRDYHNAKPLSGVVAQMRDAKKVLPEAKIILHTSRGMNSCGGDVALAEAKNRTTLEEWLERNDVPYDEIVFGKPLADVYVDDKAMKPEAFADLGVKVYRGFSGAEIVRVGDIVVKTCSNAIEQRDWYEGIPEYVKRFVSLPKLYSVTLGKLYMEHVAGYVGSEYVASSANAKGFIDDLVRVVHSFAACSVPGENDVEAYCRMIEERAAVAGVDATPVTSTLCRFSGPLATRTFCHGDFSLQNVIVRENGQICLIDPSPKDCLWTWYLDAAKLRASLAGLDMAITRRIYNLSHLLPHFDSLFSTEDLELIRALEKSHYIRVLYYAVKRGDRLAEYLLRNLLSL